MSELDKIADKMAGDLDAGDKAAAATLLSQQFSILKPEDLNTLIKAVESKEKDSIGYDMAVKLDADGVFEHVSLLPGNENVSAKLMASLMDEGKGPEAMALMDRVVENIVLRNAREVLGTNGDYRLWLKAVDAYEKDGIGHDMKMDLNILDIKTGVTWSVNAKPEVAPSKAGIGDKSLDIPALSFEKS